MTTSIFGGDAVKKEDEDGDGDEDRAFTPGEQAYVKEKMADDKLFGVNGNANGEEEAV